MNVTCPHCHQQQDWLGKPGDPTTCGACHKAFGTWPSAAPPPTPRRQEEAAEHRIAINAAAGGVGCLGITLVIAAIGLIVSFSNSYFHADPVLCILLSALIFAFLVLCLALMAIIRLLSSIARTLYADRQDRSQGN